MTNILRTNIPIDENTLFEKKWFFSTINKYVSIHKKELIFSWGHMKCICCNIFYHIYVQYVFFFYCLFFFPENKKSLSIHVHLNDIKLNKCDLICCRFTSLLLDIYVRSIDEWLCFILHLCTFSAKISDRQNKELLSFIFFFI